MKTQLGLGLSLVTSMLLAKEKQQVEKPNILWIVTDDQRADALACWNRATTGKPESALGFVSSPYLDQLAAEGVLFTRSYCNSPLSGPSRASMQTGKYPHHNGMFNFQLKHNEHDHADPMVPELMREAGYQASAFGKLGYYIYKYQDKMTYTYPESHYENMVSERNIESAQIADFNIQKVKGQTTENWYYPDGRKISYKVYKHEGEQDPDNEADKQRFYREQEVIIPKNNAAALFLGGESPMPTSKTEDGRILEVFQEYLLHENQDYVSVAKKKVQGVDPSKPQFIHLGFHFPHTPVMPSKEYRDQFKDKPYKLPVFEEWEVDKMPDQMKKWQQNFSFMVYNEQEQQQMIQDYYAFCAMGDALIGKAVEDFKAYSEKHNQPYMIVFACGDHGWHLGEQGTYFKWTGYLKSNETAVIVVSSDKKAFPAGKVVNDFVEYVDFAPTFYAQAGYDLKQGRFEFLDGRDLKRTAHKKDKPRDYVLGEVNVYGNRAFLRGHDFSFSMRSRKGTGTPSLKDLPNSTVKWPLECKPEDAEMALYDLRVDPLERNNVAYDEEYAELAAWFRKKLGNIVLGDGRFEAVWDQKNVYNVSSFAQGSDDKRLDIPKKIIPQI